MGMFRRQSEDAAPLGSTGYTVLDAHVVVRGDIETNGTLRIDGRLEGNVLRAGSVVVGPTGSVVGNVFAAEMVLGGSINGNVDVDRRVELEATAIVVGDIAADAILIHEGGKVHGRLQIRSEAAERERAKASSGPTLRLPSPAAADA
ncbi:MAG: polymer-forming cytoskeletal protein [Gemmatimonadaceae bacterium]|nr:polymer-forming cytoskeletal protein [Gemmatimonadaceae bacterium]